MQFEATLDFARGADAADPLRGFRAEFAVPRAPQPESIYLCGHSLGLAPLDAAARVNEELADWRALGVAGHLAARRPWIDYADRLATALEPLTGATARQLVAMNSLTVNLHLLLASFYRPHGQRSRVLIERGAFSSDRHAVAAQIAWHGFDPEAELIELGQGDEPLGIDQIEAAIAAAGDSLALVLWPGVQYYSGQAFDCRRIARAAHAVGALAGFDHAHAIGNLALDLPGDDADFAVWCSYKYLNGGPGAIGGAYIHERHSRDRQRPRLAGWWGHEASSRFEMRPGFIPADGAAGFAVSNPPIFSAAPLLASLELFEKAGVPALRRKSIALTGYLEFLLQQRLAGSVAIVTPPVAAERGCQLSVRPRMAVQASKLFERVSQLGVVCDLRGDVLRFAPVPLYNGFEDVWHAVDRLAMAQRQLTG